MPPVLHVAFDELPARGAQQMFASDGAFRYRHRHHVLQLIAETVGSAELIERGPRPDAARKCLVEQPAIQDDIHAGIRSGYLHSTAAGWSGDPLRPMNSARSHVNAVWRPPKSAKLTRPPNSPDHRLRARIARDFESSSVTT